MYEVFWKQQIILENKWANGKCFKHLIDHLALMGNKWILLIDKTPSKIGLFLVVFKVFLKKHAKSFIKTIKN
jgi:hypothetical protein